VALSALFKLATLTGQNKYADHALDVLNLYSEHLSRIPDQFAGLLNVLDFYLADDPQIAFILPSGMTEAQEEAAKEMLFCLHRKYQPNRVLLVAREGDAELASLSPLAKDRTALGGKPTVYICKNFTCERPINDLNDLKAAIAAW
jgi:hypothetical protein